MLFGNRETRRVSSCRHDCTTTAKSHRGCSRSRRRRAARSTPSATRRRTSCSRSGTSVPLTRGTRRTAPSGRSARKHGTRRLRATSTSSSSGSATAAHSARSLVSRPANGPAFSLPRATRGAGKVVRLPASHALFVFLIVDDVLVFLSFVLCFFERGFFFSSGESE